MKKTSQHSSVQRVSAATTPPRATPARLRAARGLLMASVLSFLNLAGAFLALAMLGGFGAWSKWQFAGLFGVTETAMGVAFIIGPNIWRLPVAEAQTSDRTAIRLAAQTVLIPHWVALAKAAAGAAIVIAVAVHEGVGLGALALPLLVALLAAALIALSLAVARLGVARPDLYLDVVWLVVRRPGHTDRELPGISLGGMVLQLLTNIGLWPVVQVFPPSILYQPLLAPSRGIVLGAAGAALAFSVVAWALWFGRISLRAPLEQQREAEAELTR